MSDIEINSLPSMWNERLKGLSVIGDQDGVADLIDTVKEHIEHIDAFDMQWQQIIEGASVCGLPIEVSKRYALILFNRQGGRCALTGLPISFRGQGYRQVWAASNDAFLDRIDAHRGYIHGNVWWVHRDVNRMKLDLPLPRLLDLCRMITDREGAGDISAPKRAPRAAYPNTTSGPVQIVSRFVSERAENDPLHKESSAALWKSFQAWHQMKGAASLTQTAFGRALRSLGYESKRGHTVSWHGLRLVSREGERV